MADSGAGEASSRVRMLLLLLVAAFAGSSLAQAPDNRTEAAAAARACTYTVKVKTSCASPARTSDAVSVAFGDAYRNEAYGARLPAPPGGRAFERCGADTFRVSGACGYGVCYLYLRRAGRSGWTPDWVRVYEPTAPGAPSTFRYGDPLPNNVWYGFNRCLHRVSSSSALSDGAAAVQAM